MSSRAILALALLIVPAIRPSGAAARQSLPDTVDGAVYHGIGGPRVRVLFVSQDSLVAVRVLAVLRGESPLPGLPDSVPYGVTAVLPHTRRAFDVFSGGTGPEWRAGVAIPSKDVLVVPSDEVGSMLGVEGVRILRHEWAHLGLHGYLEGLRIPRWFDEGYAQWASGGWDAGAAWRLRVLFALGHAPPLDSLSLTWPRDLASARAAYLLSASAVSYLFRRTGPGGLAEFFDQWRRTASLEAALRGTYGVTEGQFEEGWRRYAKSHYGWLFVLSHSAVFWTLLALVALLLVRTRSRLTRERMAHLRAEEGPDEPAFWRVQDDTPGPGDEDGG